MIDLIVKSVVNSNAKIDSIVKNISNKDNKKLISSIMLTITIWSISSLVKQHEEKIKALETEIEGIKSKLA